jgi:hypothetical protein
MLFGNKLHIILMVEFIITVELLLEKITQVSVILMIEIEMHLFHQSLLTLGYLMKILVYGKLQLLDPTDGNMYKWNEEILNWELMNG